MRSRLRRTLVLVAVMAVLPAPAACYRYVAAEAPAPPAAHPDDHAHQSPAAARDYTRDDVRFMHHMIMHHAQALAMTELVEARTTRPDIRLLAERIDVSQRDEIAQMERWLRARGEEVPGSPSHGAGHDPGAGAHQVPGMLTPAELDRLAAARGPDFDALFISSMIRHHEGAIEMVIQLFNLPGAGQQTEIFRLASDVYADQRAEIARMRTIQSQRQ